MAFKIGIDIDGLGGLPDSCLVRLDYHTSSPAAAVDVKLTGKGPTKLAAVNACKSYITRTMAELEKVQERLDTEIVSPLDDLVKEYQNSKVVTMYRDVDIRSMSQEELRAVIHDMVKSSIKERR